MKKNNRDQILVHVLRHLFIAVCLITNAFSMEKKPGSSNIVEFYIPYYEILGNKIEAYEKLSMYPEKLTIGTPSTGDPDEAHLSFHNF